MSDLAGDETFAVGAKVEVSRRDALLPATIVTRRKNGFEVEYELEARKASQEKRRRRSALREEVESSAVRPSLPRVSEGFVPGDEVDALFRGAWREGVVVRAVGECSGFWVHLRVLSKQLEFEASEMRIHREWVRGRWVPPLQDRSSSKEKKAEKASGKKLRKGTLVEVSIDEDGFQGSWYAATVLVAVDKTKYRVQYKTLRREDDKEFVIEEFDAKNVRPYPPEAIVVDGFTLKESVDALYNDGWWEGVICRVLKEGRYKVYFKGSDTELVFEHSYLRPRQNWIDGVWVVASDSQ